MLESSSLVAAKGNFAFLRGAITAPIPPHHLEEQRVHARVVGQFRMESGRQDLSFSYQHGMMFALSQHFHSFPHSLDAGRPDKDHLQIRPAELGRCTHDGAVNLPPVSIPLDGNVECIQALLHGITHLLCQQDRAGTGSKGGFAGDEIAQLLKETFSLQKLEECRGFTARDNQAIDGLKLSGFADKDCASAQTVERLAMRIKVTLKGENTYCEFAIIHEN
jgi:hypothetical protein